MTKTAEAVVIGGGVMGASILYNLVSRGVDSAVLLERDTLGSGSTGRSSGVIRMHYSTEVNARLAWESFGILRDFEQIVGAGDAGWVHTAPGRRPARSPIDGLRQNIEMQQSVGIDTRIISLEEARELAPASICRATKASRGEPQSGYGDPSGTALGYSARARELGATVEPGVARDGDRDRERPGHGCHDRHRAVRDSDPPSSRPAPGLPASSRRSWDWISLGGHPARGLFPAQVDGDAVFSPDRGGHGQSDLLQARGVGLMLVGNGNAEDVVDPDAFNPAPLWTTWRTYGCGCHGASQRWPTRST